MKIITLKQIWENTKKEILTWKKELSFIGILSLVFVTIGNWASIKSLFGEENTPLTQIINSNNQTNNITADNIEINFEKQYRVLTPNDKKTLLENINKNKTTIITTVFGDDEALRFASQIKSFLLTEKYNVSGVHFTVSETPPKGKQIFLNKNGDFQVLIGTQF